MAKGKRVSNKSGGSPGRRSSKTVERYFANVRRRKAVAAAGRTIDVPKSTTPRRIPGPARSSILGRLVAPVKRFFRGG